MSLLSDYANWSRNLGSNIWGNLGVRTGSWGTPEFGVTETSASELSGGGTTDLSNAISGNYPSAQTSPDYSDAYSQLNYSPTGDVLGTSTTGGNTTTTSTSTGDSGGTSGGQLSSEDQIKQDYINQINSIYGPMEANLDPWRASQEATAQNSYNQNISDLTAQGSQNEKDVLSNQVKTLKDLANNIKNQYMAGNVYLGARGAGDSSAANMYSYAINKLGSKARGDVLSQTGAQLAKLKNIVLQESGRLKTEKDQQLQNVAQWFYNAKQQLAGLKGQDLMAMTNTFLNQALSNLNQINTNYQARTSALQEWAMNNSKTLGELKTNMQGISSVMPRYGNISGNPQFGLQGNYQAPVGFGFSSDEEKKLFG